MAYPSVYKKRRREHLHWIKTFRALGLLESLKARQAQAARERVAILKAYPSP